MGKSTNGLDIISRCHVNTNSDGDRFVGLKANTEGANIYFPLGYDLPTEDIQLRKDIQNLFRILSKFLKKESTLQNDNLSTSHTVNFPLHAYMQIIKDYLNRGGYYVEKERIYKTSTRGKIVWKQTLKKQKPLATKTGKLVFTETTIQTSAQNKKKLITEIHKFCVYKSFEKLGWLFLSTMPPKFCLPCSLIHAQHILIDAIGNTNDDSKKVLFKSMIDILRYLDDHSNDLCFYFGTEDFDNIWEKLIDNAFGIRDKEQYLPHTRWVLDFGKTKEKKPLIPDTIMVYKDKCYVLDAKYYRYGATGNPDHLPNGTDINKQITYGEYVKQNMCFKSDAIFNAFIFPFNSNNNPFGIKDNMTNIGEALGDWRQNKEYYERIQGIVIDTRYLMFHYTERNIDCWQSLVDHIERVTQRSSV